MKNSRFQHRKFYFKVNSLACRTAKAAAPILEPDAAAVFEVAIRLGKYGVLAEHRCDSAALAVDSHAAEVGAAFVSRQQKQAKLAGAALQSAGARAAPVRADVLPPAEPAANEHREPAVAGVLAAGKLPDPKFKLEEVAGAAQILPAGANSKVNSRRQQLLRRQFGGRVQAGWNDAPAQAVAQEVEQPQVSAGGSLGQPHRLPQDERGVARLAGCLRRWR